MRISDIKIHALGFHRLPAMHLLPELNLPINLLRVFTDEGMEGNCMTQYIRAESFAEVIGYLKKILIGTDPFDREKVWQKVCKLGELNVGVGLGLTLSAVDMALWDIAGKTLKLPVFKLLGGCKEKVQAYASTVTYSSVKEFVDLSVECVEKGYNALKLHPWGIPKLDIELAKVIRETVGEEVSLMFDIQYGREEALKVGRELDLLGFEWFEDPLSNCDIDGCVRLAKALDTPLKIGEEISAWVPTASIRLLHECIRRGAADIIGAKGDACGGITGMRKIADTCETASVRFEPHNYGPTLVQAAHFQIELAHGNCHFFELPVPEGIFDIGMKDVFRIDNEGYVIAPVKPGLGVEIDWMKIDELTSKVY